MALTCALLLATGFGANAAAQAPAEAPAKISGQVLDIMGMPYAGVVVVLKNVDLNKEFQATADNQGRFNQGGLPAGNYSVTLKAKGNAVFQSTTILTAGQNASLNMNLKQLQAQQGAAAVTAEKDKEKQNDEAKAKFSAMKGHFDAGSAALDQAKQTRAQYDKLPANQQASMQGQLDQAAGTAITELQAALDGTGETDNNRNIILARLGDAYSTDNKFTEAAGAYQKAVALKPDPGYYNNLGNSLARIGKVDEALAAYQKAIELDPTQTAVYWRNFAIGLYNTGRIKESVDPLRKATDADGKNAQAWYLLGAALVNTMEFKQDGDKMIPVIQPGTQEAYQKAIDLDPTGPWGAQAKQGIEALQAMGVGIDTKVNQRASNPNQKATPAPKKK
jgi:tetratricopeptide (TPR) repeat protein